MKKFFLAIIALLYIQFSFGQRITVDPGMEKLNDEFQPAYTLFIPHATPKMALRAFADFLKDNHAKAKTSGDELNVSNVVISAISKDTLQVSAKSAPVAEGAVLVVGFKTNAGFIGESSNPSESQSIVRILKDLALPVAKEGLDDKIKDAEKVLESKEKEKESLEKRNERLASENKKMQDQIHDNEREMEENKNKIESAKGTVSNSKDALDAIKLKQKDL